MQHVLRQKEEILSYGARLPAAHESAPRGPPLMHPAAAIIVSAEPVSTIKLNSFAGVPTDMLRK